jgi:hypothetical protein
MSYVIDALLNCGNAFQSQVKQAHIMLFFEIGASERRFRECASTESVLDGHNTIDD